MGFAQKIKGLWNSGAEGSERGPWYGQSGESGSFFELGRLDDGWQRNLHLPDGIDAKKIPAAYASVMASARACSQCQPVHKIRDEEGKWDKTEESSVAAILRRPNSYETFAQYILNAVSQLHFAGESFSLAIRN